MLLPAAELNDYIRGLYKSTCCRVLVHGLDFGGEERKAHCIKITGLVAFWLPCRKLRALALVLCWASAGRQSLHQPRS